MARNEGSVEASRLRTLIGVEGVSKAYGQGKERVSALVDVSLEVEPGELFAIVGPSGCGKSTLLDLIAGFASPDEGRFWCTVRRLLGRIRDGFLSSRSTGFFPGVRLWPMWSWDWRCRVCRGWIAGERPGSGSG